MKKNEFYQKNNPCINRTKNANFSVNSVVNYQIFLEKFLVWLTVEFFMKLK